MKHTSSLLWPLTFVVLSLGLLTTQTSHAQINGINAWFPSACPIPTIIVNVPQGGISPSANSWKLVFEDNFDGSAIDRSKWETSFPYPSPADRARPDEGPCIYRDQNIVLNQGIANVQVRQEANVQSYPLVNPVLTSRYTGGMMITKDAIRFNQGRFEMRCRFPVGNVSNYPLNDPSRPNRWLGRPLWPAFWLIGGECGTEEIDVFELNDTQFSDHGRMFATLHGIAGGLINTTRNVTCDNCIGATPSSQRMIDGMGLADGQFHVFALEWEPACITWFVDGVAVKHHYRFTTQVGQTLGCSAPAGFNLQHPMWPFHDLQIIISMGMGTETPDGTINFTGSDNAASLEVDYARVYQRIPANDPKNLCSGTIIGENVVCTADNYAANFRTQTTQVNWTCSSNLVLSSTTGSSVTVSPASTGLTEQGWIAAEPVFANSSACNAADARVTKDVWIGLPIAFSNLAALVGVANPENTSSCQNFRWCANIPGASLMGATWEWTLAAPVQRLNRVSESNMDDSVHTHVARPSPSIPGPIGPGGGGGPACGCVRFTTPCVTGDWYDYPSAAPSVPYSVSISNRCGTVTYGGNRIYRPLSCSGPANPPGGGTLPKQAKTKSAKPYFYPNPANSSLIINGSEAATSGKLFLYNAHGKIVFTSTLNQRQQTIDTREFPSGVYILKIVGDATMTNDQVLINHESNQVNP